MKDNVTPLHKKKAVEAMGHEPLNPIGQCFESAAYQVVIGGVENNPDDVRLVHGIVTANFPGQEGMIVGHAWVEGDGVALDTTWGKNFPKEAYRKALKATYVVEYTMQEAHELWSTQGNAGPWDAKIKAIVDQNKTNRELLERATNEGKQTN